MHWGYLGLSTFILVMEVAASSNETREYYNYVNFELMDPIKVLEIVDKLIDLYYPGKKCILAFQDVPHNTHRVLYNIKQ